MVVKSAKETSLFDYFKYQIEMEYRFHSANSAYTENLRNIVSWYGAGWITVSEENDLREINRDVYHDYDFI